MRVLLRMEEKRKRGLFLVLILLLAGFQGLSAAADDSLGVRRVIIDPGHGGKDPGCLGKFSHEADVALAISKLLGDMIIKEYGNEVEVIYTRIKDDFVELAERAKIANRKKADLFICIHANSGPSHAKGTETYVLGLHKSDAQFKVAQRENEVIMIEENYTTKYENFDVKDPDAYIYLTLATSAYMDQSIAFAERIQNNVKKTPKVTDRGVKQAGFLVLHQVSMPSVLVETGFLTNPEEEKVLNEKESQENIARAIFNAFVDYKEEVEKRSGVKPKGENSSSVKEKEIPKENKTEVKVDGQSTTNKEEKVAEEDSNIKNIKEFTPVEKKDQIVFKVQIATSASKLETTPQNFKGLNNVEVYQERGIYKYTYGKSGTFDEARKLQTEAREKGYTDAFVVAFKNGERMDVQEARKQANR